MAQVSPLLQWLGLLTSQAQAADRPPLAPAGPQTRVGNTYQGAALPPGISSLLALSGDHMEQGAARRAAGRTKWEQQIAGNPQAMRLDTGATALLNSLFDHAQTNGWHVPSDRAADRMANRSGYFDLGNGWNDEQRQNALIDGWFKKWGPK